MPRHLTENDALESRVFSRPGMLAVGEGETELPMEDSYEIVSVGVYAKTVPVGSSAVLDVKKNGASIYGTPANRPTISAGSHSATIGAHSVLDLAPGDTLRVDTVSVGATTAGGDVSVSVRLRRVVG